MLSVLIVDDEVITRKGLKGHVNWEKLKVDKIYDSGNAAEALEMVRRYKPDLILSDVCMPGMNGIEMCSQIRAIHKDCQIVFLSGYSDKEFLMGAISLEAVSYVEKPIDIEEVEEALGRAAAKQLKSKLKKEKIRRLVTENHSLTSKRLVERLCIPNVKQEHLETDFTRLKLDWNQMQEFAVVLFKLCPREGHGTEQLVREIRQEFSGISYLCSMKEYRYLVFICAFLHPGEPESLELAQRLQNQMQAYGDGQAPYYCAIGERTNSLSQIYASYQSAVIKMQQLCFFNRAHFGYGGNLPEENLNFDEKIFGDFTQAVQQYKEEAAKNAMERLYTFLIRQQGVMVSSIKGIYFRFIDVLFQKAEYKTGNGKGKNAEIVGLIWEKLHGLDTVEQCHRYLLEETEDYFKNVEELAESNQTIIQIISYIQSHYQEVEFCLENIAEHVYLSPNYLSSLFRKKMGKTISQYIADVRVEHAKELLRDRKLKLYDIAVRTGYKDANYFTKIFKKAVGVTPSEYREKYNI